MSVQGKCFMTAPQRPEGVVYEGDEESPESRFAVQGYEPVLQKHRTQKPSQAFYPGP